TASAFAHERDSTIESGADDFVAKPFRLETIFAKLAEHLGVRYRYEAESPAALEGAGEDRDELLTRGRIAPLPGELVRALCEALLRGDVDEAQEVAGRVQAHDDPLGRALQAEIRAFRL